jgi:hypothetical protein
MSFGGVIVHEIEQTLHRITPASKEILHRKRPSTVSHRPSKLFSNKQTLKPLKTKKQPGSAGSLDRMMVGQPWPAANGRQRFKAASTSRQDDDAKRLSTIRSTGLTVSPVQKVNKCAM